jgi:hypothetical protein
MAGKWTKLIEFRFPYDTISRWARKSGLLLQAMYDAPSLKTVYMPASYKPEIVSRLLAKPSLDAIYSETPFGMAAGYRIRGVNDQLSMQQSEFCHKIHYPLPGPWAPAHRPYEAMQAQSK